MVNVLPDPVTPSRTCHGSPRSRPASSSAMARAWSPRNSKSETRVNRSVDGGMALARRMRDGAYGSLRYGAQYPWRVRTFTPGRVTLISTFRHVPSSFVFDDR